MGDRLWVMGWGAEGEGRKAEGENRKSGKARKRERRTWGAWKMGQTRAVKAEGGRRKPQAGAERGGRQEWNGRWVESRNEQAGLR